MVCNVDMQMGQGQARSQSQCMEMMMPARRKVGYGIYGVWCSLFVGLIDPPGGATRTASRHRQIHRPCLYFYSAEENRNQSRSVCLSVCPRASATIYPEPCIRASPNVCECYVPWPWLGPPLAALRYVMYFRFCG